MSSYTDLREVDADKVMSIANRFTPVRRKFSTVLFDDVRLNPEPEMLVSGLLTAGGLSALWGEPGCGKSFFAVAMALAVATGREFLDHRVQQGGVVYVAAEGGRGLEKRLVAYRERFSPPAGTPFALIHDAVDLCTEDHETAALIAEIRDKAEAMGVPVKLVVLDTLARVMAGGNENDSQDMGALIRNADLIRKVTGAHVMFVHHGGKDREKKTRGHSSFYGALDTAVEIVADKSSGLKTATVQKQKDAEDGGDLHFRLDVITIGEQGGEPITSCVVVAGEAQEARPPVRERKLSATSAIALDALRRAVEDHGTAPPASNHIPASVRVVSPDLWRKNFYQMRADDTPEANKKAFQRATADLQAKKLAATWGEYSWLM